MTEETQGDGYTLGLLVDLRDVCRKIGDNHYRMAAELHDLLRKVANPEVHGLDKSSRFESNRPLPVRTARRCGRSRSTATPTWPGPRLRPR